MQSAGAAVQVPGAFSSQVLFAAQSAVLHLHSAVFTIVFLVSVHAATVLHFVAALVLHTLSLAAQTLPPQLQLPFLRIVVPSRLEQSAGAAAHRFLELSQV